MEDITRKHVRILADRLNIQLKKVENTISLLAEGATIPFIARYRKELTGSLDEVQIGDIKSGWEKLKELEKRRESILQTIENQGKMTDELRKRIEETYDANELEDIYLPYKQKRKTRATVARERGLEPLANLLLLQMHQGELDILAKPFLSNDVPDVEAALGGARDIIAETVSENEKVRGIVRQTFAREAIIEAKSVKSKEAEGVKYKDYFAFSESLNKCPSHRLLAMRRGEEEGFLRLSIMPTDENKLLNKLDDEFLTASNQCTDQVAKAVEDAYDRLIAPSIETEFRNQAKERADAEAIRVFVENLRQLLLSAPLGQRRVMGIDPGFRTGCKVVILSDTGALLDNFTIYPHPPQYQEREAAEKIEKAVEKYNIEAISIGNGTAGRETETMIRTLKFKQNIDIFMVSEAGASIYSASEVAREEFPTQDITVRGAVSIGRRLMDPLAELVKIDPKSIGVGQYQHDVNQTALKDSLDRTVESCVNAVGINLNTASKHLLTYVSGLGPTLAQNIVNYRTENGLFTSRDELKKVARLGGKAFEQCAGFLRIKTPKNPLDNTAVHPESYHIVEKMAKDMKVNVATLIDDKAVREAIELKKYVSESVGLPTLQDILKELAKPGLDPRGEAKPIEFGNVHKLEDLEVGMILPGVVTNITNFGAFVDIGVKQDGLVHVSQMANKFIKNPNEVVKLQQQVQVKIIELDIARKRVMLSMKQAE
ncbi:MAG: hypothetical protein RL757_759 [Bacteroidota bacterium]|jgi:uncharacterized protein